MRATDKSAIHPPLARAASATARSLSMNAFVVSLAMGGIVGIV